MKHIRAPCAIVIKVAKRERRQHERFPQVLEVHGHCLLSGTSTPSTTKEFEGRIQNLSNGGACILSSYRLQPSSFICCKFPVSDAPVSIPSLMQVRWTAKQAYSSATYISGFEFMG